MSISLALPYRIRWGLTAGAATAMLAALVVLATTGLNHTAAGSREAASGIASAPLVRLADEHPGRSVEAIVQFDNGVSASSAHKLVRANDGRVIGELPIINGLAVRMSAARANGLAHKHGVRVVSLNATVNGIGFALVGEAGPVIVQLGSPVAAVMVKALPLTLD